MIVPGQKSLGPIASGLLRTDCWKDEYPTTPEYKEELDTLLVFAKEKGRLPQFVPRLESKPAQRDEALNELRVAYFLHQRGFPIVQWEPPGLNGKVGEYLISTPERKNVFVEVKSPGWESQLSQAEINDGRAQQPKYGEDDGGVDANCEKLQQCIKRAYKKFDPAQPNFLIVADDYHLRLFDWLEDVEVALYNNHEGYGMVGCFSSPAFENLGGVGIFREQLGVEYELRVSCNPFALPTAKLPTSISKLNEMQR